MVNLSDAFQDALASQAKTALSEVVARNRQVTVKELGQLVSSAPQLGAMTLNELLGRTPVAKARGTKRAKVASSQSPIRRGGGRKRMPAMIKRDVRRKSGRDKLDADVMAALAQCGGDMVAARQLRELLSTDPTQLRTSLNRLINAGRVTFSGKARGTRYTLV